jgi:alkylation response protein AidB-like acyl-CoA dehydrogenase
VHPGREDRLLRPDRAGRRLRRQRHQDPRLRDGDDFVLNGSKHFISHAGHADFAIVFAVTDTYEHNGSKRNAVTSFLVDRNTPGMTIRRGPNA